MRKAINENPVAQAAVIGVLAIVAAFMLLTQMKGGSTAAPDSSTVSTTVPEGTATVATTATVAPPAAAVAPAGAGSASALAEFAAGPGLPARLVSDHSRGKTIVLLVDDHKGLEDSPVRAAVKGLRGDGKLSVYVTDAKRIARYSQITQGVGVSQAPALIVVSPGDGAGAPRATVSYGFRSADSVRQAVRDAVYRGVTRGYDPG